MKDSEAKILRIQENLWSKFLNLLRGLPESQKAVGVLFDMALAGH